MLGIGVNLRTLRGTTAAVDDSASIVTWDSSADTYTQDIFAEDASIVTWDSSADTYTQDIFAEDASVVTWDSSADTYTQTIYGA